MTGSAHSSKTASSYHHQQPMRRQKRGPWWSGTELLSVTALPPQASHHQLPPCRDLATDEQR